jgi:hypothetical protein
MVYNMRFTEFVKPVVAIDSVVPSTTVPDYVSMKNFSRCAIVITVKNATTVTGSAISLLQAKTVAGGSAKALSFSRMLANIDTGAGDTLTETAVTSDTFTTDATNSKNLMYVLEVDETNLDINNGFDCIRLVTGDATAATVTAVYYLYPYSGAAPAAITN